ncbi:hypothetical protein B0H17DRAFT_1035473, partial [Mycena rosella]
LLYYRDDITAMQRSPAGPSLPAYIEHANRRVRPRRSSTSHDRMRKTYHDGPN